MIELKSPPSGPVDWYARPKALTKKGKKQKKIKIEQKQTWYRAREEGIRRLSVSMADIVVWQVDDAEPT